jgi:hypothetical protein
LGRTRRAMCAGRAREGFERNEFSHYSKASARQLRALAFILSVEVRSRFVNEWI